MSKQLILQSELERLNKALSSLKGSLLSSLDGMPIVHSVSDPSIDPARVAAMSATALGVARRISESLKVGPTREISVQANEGKIFIYLIGDRACLSLVSEADSNLGLIQLEAAETLEKMTKALGAEI